jgi:hypothetical protein
MLGTRRASKTEDRCLERNISKELLRISSKFNVPNEKLTKKRKMTKIPTHSTIETRNMSNSKFTLLRVPEIIEQFDFKDFNHKLEYEYLVRARSIYDIALSLVLSGAINYNVNNLDFSKIDRLMELGRIKDFIVDERKTEENEKSFKLH